MGLLRPTIRLALLLSSVCLVSFSQTAPSQTNPAAAPEFPTPQIPEQGVASTPAASPNIVSRPLPDIANLMHDVESNLRKAEAVQKNYIYHSVETAQEVDGKGRVKKTSVDESDHYWVNGVPIRRIVKKDGKALTPAEVAKEDERVEKQAAKGRERRDKGDAAGKETDADGNEVITVSRLLTLGSFTNPRRVQLNGRSTIVVDYVGDPRAKTHNRAEDAIREMAGTASIDEQDHVLARVEGRFVNAFKVGGGLVADIKKDTRFTADWSKINDEVWLPARIDAQGAARVLLFFSFSGTVHVTESDYRKFRATSTIVPITTPETLASPPLLAPRP